MYEPLSISLPSSFNCIETCLKEIKAIDRAIVKTIQGISPNALTSRKFVRLVFGANVGEVCPFLKKFLKNNLKFFLTYHQNAP